jgi:hypothetical protein
MKRCRPLYDIRVQYMLRFGFEVLFMMFAKSPPVITSPSWELDFFIDLMFRLFRLFAIRAGASGLFTPTLYGCEIISSSHISLRAGEQNHQYSASDVLYQFPPSAVP